MTRRDSGSCRRGPVWAFVAVAVAVALVLGACSSAGVYNALVPTDGKTIQVAEGIAYGQMDRQKLDIYRPKETSARKLAIVVIFYGGSWSSGSREAYAFLGRAIAAQGFLALVADYRLVPDVRFPTFIEDGARAVAFVHDNATRFGGDPDALFLLGHSAGAYNAAMVALAPQYLGAHGHRTSIIRGVAALAGPYDFLPLDKASTKAAFSSASDLTQTQPTNFVSGDAPAMFLATGSDDDTVAPRHTLRLAALLERAGAPVVVKTYPGVGHIGILLTLSVPFRHRAPVLDDVVAFFRQSQARLQAR